MNLKKKKLEKKILLSLANKLNYRDSSFYSKLSINSLKELYICLEKNFPYVEDPEVHGFVSSRHYIADMKRYCLNKLTSSGSVESLDAISNLIETFPEIEWLNTRLEDTKHNYLLKACPKIEVKTLLKLVYIEDSSLINNDDELLEVVLQSLEKLQNKLQGKTPEAQFLWDTYSGRPKSENELSDYINNELIDNINKKGLILNREVEIKRNPLKGGSGNSLDLLINAISNQKGLNEGILSLIIEVKGIWHQEIKTSMEKQLLERYLNQDVNFKKGIYLVVWFDKDNWTNDDSRKKQVVKQFNDYKETKEFFEEQAKELSNKQKQLRAFVLDASL